MHGNKISRSYHPVTITHTLHYYTCGRSSIWLHLIVIIKNKYLYSCLDYLSIPCGHLSSEIPMHNYHCCKTNNIYIFFSGHGVCYSIFSTWDNRLIYYPFWNIFCWILRWIYTRTISLRPEVSLYVEHLSALVTRHRWPGRWFSTRAITISTLLALKINLVQGLFDQLLNCHNIFIW